MRCGLGRNPTLEADTNTAYLRNIINKYSYL
jgi:hypothetical protein